MPGNKKNNKVVRLGNVIERLGKLTGVIKKGTGATRSTQVGRAKPAQRATVDGTQGRRNGRTLVSRVASPIPSAPPSMPLSMVTTELVRLHSRSS